MVFNLYKGISDETMTKHKFSKKWSLVEVEMELAESNYCFENLLLSADLWTAEIQASILELYFYYAYDS